MSNRAVRVSAPLWESAKERANQRNETVSEAVRQFLTRYVHRQVQCNESCHDLNRDSCTECDSGQWERMCDSCRTEAAEVGER